MVGINKINIKLLTAALVSIVVIGGSIIFTNALSSRYKWFSIYGLSYRIIFIIFFYK